ncbi:MADS-box 15 [Zea mays]|jgi:hypothetical protein|uniref:MADS-box 15 n=1 Tax=Zea mays TaxID=4577 RepID=A0A1D6GGX4_MAIZE|nr:MADS-box 15 [Zea mays]
MKRQLNLLFCICWTVCSHCNGPWSNIYTIGMYIVAYPNWCLGILFYPIVSCRMLAYKKTIYLTDKCSGNVYVVLDL